MSEKRSEFPKRRKHSLSRKISKSVLAGCIMLGIVLLVVSLSAYVYELSIQQINTTFNLSASAREIINRNIDANIYAKQVMAIYYSMSQEERDKVGTDEYYEQFAEIERDAGYRTLKWILTDFRNSSVADYIYMAVYDKRTKAIVYVADTDSNEETYCPPGHWEKLEDRELNAFLNWDGEGVLYDFGDTEEYGYMFTSGAPIDKAGDGKSFILSDIRADSLFRRAFWFVMNFALALIIAMALFRWAIMRQMEKNVVQPINKIQKAAIQYVQDKQSNVESGNHFSELNLGTDDEIEDLSLTMGGMEMDLNDFEKDLASIAAEKERAGTELKLASKIQSDMLPLQFPAFPDRDDFDIYASMDPAREVGGDFYDFFLIDENRLGVVIADVSGKGVPAALFMMVMKSMIQTALMSGKGAAEALTNVNAQICKKEHEGMFVTVWVGILDLETGVITASNAGHEYPIIKKPGGRFEVFKDKHGFVIGGIGGLQYKEYQIDFEPGSKLFLYTDGATEATDKNETLFGMERLTDAVNGAAEGSTEEIIKAARKEIDAFVGEEEQFDDITMVCLEYVGQQGNTNVKNGEREHMEILLDVTRKAEIENVEEVTDLVDAELEKIECPMKAQIQINIAIDELYSNIAKYAYGEERGDARVILKYFEPLGEITLTFMDSGSLYDPTAQAEPDVTLPAEKRSIGGLGLLLVKKSMDGMEYEFKDGMNCLTIKKKIK